MKPGRKKAKLSYLNFCLVYNILQSRFSDEELSVPDFQGPADIIFTAVLSLMFLLTIAIAVALLKIRLDSESES